MGRSLMTKLKTHFKNLEKVALLAIFFTIFLQSCMQSPNTRKVSAKAGNTTNSTNNTKLPVFASGNNFIQNGLSIYTSTINLDMTFADSLQLRGKDVDTYIRSAGTSTVVCLANRFTQVNKIILLAAIPRSVYNFTTQSLEYYYGITPSDSASNQSFCQKTGLINQLSIYYPALTPKYKMADICTSTTCASTSYLSQSLELYSATGIALSQIATKQLLFSVTYTPTSTTPVGQTCTSSTQCTSLGYDCCSSGQCVTDLSLKPGVNPSAPTPEYAQALQDILNNPSNIYLYPQFYFICSQPTTTPTTPTTPVDSNTEAAIRLRDLNDLYSCTNKVEGEYGVCTATYKNVVLTNGTSPVLLSGLDDRSFADTFTHLTVNKQTLVSVEKVLFGGVVVYDYALKNDSDLIQNIYDDTSVNIEGSQNDDTTSGTKVRVKSKPTAAASNDVQIKYKADVSCVKVNASLAKCEKYYIQDQGSPANELGVSTELIRKRRLTNHYPTTNNFKLPTYASTGRAITVEVDGILQRQDIDWQLTLGTTNSIDFLPASTLKVSKDQKVRITYFADLVAYPNIMKSKQAALDKIATICSCTNNTVCNLAPIKNATNQIVDYACVYPEPTPVDPPQSQKIYLSSKAVPVRLFDQLGTTQKAINSATVQEGILFKYRSDNLLNPNNVPDITLSSDTADHYVGFNEIYGSLTYANNSAKPAQEVAVKKNTSYDIYVDSGAYSSCLQCGNDYYSQLTKLFPLTQFAGGASPLIGQTNRTMSGGIRSDELKFGRACLVPASMLPWSHATYTKEQDQRLNRMSAQHFLYANGYQYDWYGFDYGSVIGSFDGVKWFSIGSNRRIKAESNKMFIAVNGVFGDLTVENTYTVTVNDSTLNPDGTNMVTSDYNSDGAECQQYHQCSTDNDCATTLGWEYACAPVGEITTSWPKFDDNAKEIPDSSSDKTLLSSILGVSNPGKRCVYRGRGALCTPSYTSVNLNSTFNKTSNPAMHGCSDNNYCQTITTNGVSSPNFNNRIVRYGRVRSDSNVDTFGLAALVAGRPYAFNAVETPRAEMMKNINSNKIQGMCLPGRDIEKDSFLEQNLSTPAVGEFNGDKVLGIGMTYRKSTVAATSNYLMACSIMDTSKNFYRNTTSSSSSSFSNLSVYPTMKYDAGSQALSTNALNIFNSIFTSKGMTLGIYKTNAAILNTQALTENRCMRAPGSACFSDLDCGPSKLVTDKIKVLNAEDSTVNSILNKYEIKFWQEELVCAQAVKKTSELYDPKNNRCCRDLGNTISIASADTSNGIDYKKVPGIDQPMATPTRYSRSSTMYKEINTNSATYPELRTAVADQCASAGGCPQVSSLINQYRTLAALAEKTSCSGDWVRNFANGTHKWEVSRLQSYSASMFQCLNWYPGNGGYTCAGYAQDDPNCPIVQTSPTSTKAKDVLNYLGRLELMGIPQIALEPESYYNDTVERGFSCKSWPGDRSHAYPTNASALQANYAAPSQLFTSGAVGEYVDGTGLQWLSAGDTTNFKTMKQVFKADEVVSCSPAGTQMKAGDDPGLCCTGTINATTLKCQLNDYIDISVYTNRYVSSEAKKLSATLFDQYGYVKDPSYAANLACEQQMCSSGVVAYGILISRLKTPGQAGGSDDSKIFRFLENSSSVDNLNTLLDIFNKGLKLNNHAYCVPKALLDSATSANSTDITFVQCNQ